jgi:hypothetical protein
MTIMSVVLAGLLTAGVVGLAVVPYFRAVTPGGGSQRLPDDLRRQIERELAERYCLGCGVPFDRADAGRCESCGAERPVVRR